MGRILCCFHCSHVVQIILGVLECRGHVTFPKPCPKPALGLCGEARESFDCHSRALCALCHFGVKETFVLSLRLFSPGVHASPRLDDAGTSVWAFGQVVCSVPEVRRPHSRTPSLHGLLLIWQHRISQIPRGVVVFENWVQKWLAPLEPIVYLTLLAFIYSQIIIHQNNSSQHPSGWNSSSSILFWMCLFPL